jgi:hypothetical protein
MAVALMPAAACSVLGIEFVTGSGKAATQTYEAKGFKNVEVHSAFEVTLTRGDQFDVALTTDDNLMEFMKVTSDGETLFVAVETGKNLRPRAGMKLAITMPVVEGVRLHGACNGTLKGFNGGKDLTIQVEGASKIKGDVDAGNVEVVANGASNVTLRGTASAVEVEGNGASQVHLDDLKVARAKVQLSGASSGAVQATDKLDYEISGASHLDYRGHPSLGRHDTSGASSAKEK